MVKNGSQTEGLTWLWRMTQILFSREQEPDFCMNKLDSDKVKPEKKVML